MRTGERDCSSICLCFACLLLRTGHSTTRDISQNGFRMKDLERDVSQTDRVAWRRNGAPMKVHAPRQEVGRVGQTVTIAKPTSSLGLAVPCGWHG